MRRTLELIAAPTGMQPGGYVPHAYADRDQPLTRIAVLQAERTPSGWRIELSWECPDPVSDAGGDTNHFVDAAAVLAPLADDAPWVTMGAPDKPLEGMLWRADQEALYWVRSTGLGTAERGDAPAGWSVAAGWREGRWHVAFDLGPWSVLDERRRLAVAVWRGASGDRGGLKSVTPGWIALDG